MTDPKSPTPDRDEEILASLDDEDFEMQPKHLRPSQQVRTSGIMRAIRDDDPRLTGDVGGGSDKG